LVPSQTSPSLWFRTRFPGKSHNHTVVDPATTQALINHIGSTSNTCVATNNKRFGRGRHSATAPEPTDRRGVGHWGKPPAGLLAMSPFEFLFRGTREKRGGNPEKRHGNPKKNRRLPGNKRARCGIALMMIGRKIILL